MTQVDICKVFSQQWKQDLNWAACPRALYSVAEVIESYCVPSPCKHLFKGNLTEL